MLSDATASDQALFGHSAVILGVFVATLLLAQPAVSLDKLSLQLASQDLSAWLQATAQQQSQPYRAIAEIGLPGSLTVDGLL